MRSKNWKLTLTGVAAVLAVTAIMTFGTLAQPRTAPRIAAQMPEVVVVTMPAANAGNAAELAGAEAFVYPAAR